MDISDPKTGDFTRSVFRWLAAVVLLAAFASSLWINFSLRLPVEAGDRVVGLLVDYDELRRVADGSQDISFADMARKAATAGATGIVVRERILADWENAGDILTLTGSELTFHFPGSAGLNIVNGKTYILTKDAQVFEQMYSLLEVKKRYPDSFDFQGYKCIEVGLSSLERATLGLGYPLKQLGEAARAGLQIIARVRNWEPVRGDSINTVFDWVSRIPNLAGIGFNDMSVPGGGVNPVLQDMLAGAIKTVGVPLISFEFYDQAGLAGLADRIDNRVFRAHAIAENELRKYSNVTDAVDRYKLAASERNIRYIYARFYGLENPAASMMSNMELIEAIADGLADEGLRIGDPALIKPYDVSFVCRYVAGLGVVMAAVCLAAFVLEAGARYKVYKSLIIRACLFIAGAAAWAGLLVMYPVIARKICALGGAVFFPSLGIALFTRKEPPLLCRERASGRHARVAAEPREPRVLVSAATPRMSPGAEEHEKREEAEKPRLSHVRVIYGDAPRPPDPEIEDIADGANETGAADDESSPVLIPVGADGKGSTVANDGKGNPVLNPVANDDKGSMVVAAAAINADIVTVSADTSIPALNPAVAGVDDPPGDGGVETNVRAHGFFFRLFRAALIFFGMSAFTFAGAMIMSSLLADAAFMLKLDSFAGVKLAHILPLLIITLTLILRDEDPLGLVAGAARDKVRFWQLFAGAILLAGLVIYIIRTGNDSLGVVSELEARFRQYLGRVLTVRPRTKEFLIGHPAMLILLYFGYRHETLSVLLVGAIGQVSLINTYAHIHTPLITSILRSLHGLWIGLIIGGLSIAVLSALLNKLSIKNKGGDPVDIGPGEVAAASAAGEGARE